MTCSVCQGTGYLLGAGPDRGNPKCSACGSTDRGAWIQTLAGRKVYPLDPRPEDVDVPEMAHALSHLCRYNGHVPHFYSVAQHSVHVSEAVEATCATCRGDGQVAGVVCGRCAGRGKDVRLQLVALLHDLPEAYLGDVIRPIKKGGGVTTRYEEAEQRWGLCIGKHLDIPGLGELLADLPEEVKIADDRVLLAEKRDLRARGLTDESWSVRPYPPWGGTVEPWLSTDAYRQFMERYEDLKEAAEALYGDHADLP